METYTYAQYRESAEVLRARLADAEFFYTEDLKDDMSDKVEQSAAVVFHEKLGTTRQGAVRVSFSFFNKMREIDALYRRLRELARIYA